MPGNLTLIRTLQVALVVVLLTMAATALTVLDIQTGRYRPVSAAPDPALVQNEYGGGNLTTSVSATFDATPVAGDLLVASRRK